MVCIGPLFRLLLYGLESRGLLLPGELLLVGSEPLHLVVGPGAAAAGLARPPAALLLLPRGPHGGGIVRVVAVLLPLPLVGLHHALALHRVRGGHRQRLRDHLPGGHLVLEVGGRHGRGLQRHHAVIVVILRVVAVIRGTVVRVVAPSNVSGESKKLGLCTRIR